MHPFLSSFLPSFLPTIGTAAHCGLWPVEQCPSIFFLSVTNSLHLLTPSTWRSLSTSSFHLSWAFPFFSSLPVLEWRSFWASYPPPFSLGDLTTLSFALLSILLYCLLCSSLLVLVGIYCKNIPTEIRTGNLPYCCQQRTWSERPFSFCT